MQKKYLKSILLIVMLSIQLIACNSPQEEAKKYLDSGYQFLEDGEYSKAI